LKGVKVAQAGLAAIGAEPDAARGKEYIGRAQGPGATEVRGKPALISAFMYSVADVVVAP
jgi:hypothetical protein